MDRLIEIEERFEERVRRVAWFSWAAAFACLPLLGLCAFLVSDGAGSSVDIARAAVITLGVGGGLALLLALLSTLAWLFRRRSASLVEIGQRLSNLEAMLRQQGHDVR